MNQSSKDSIDPGVVGMPYFINQGIPQSPRSLVASSYQNGESRKEIKQYNNNKSESEAFDYATGGEWGKLSEKDREKIVSEMKVLRETYDKKANKALKGRKYLTFGMVIAVLIYIGKQRGSIPSYMFPSFSTVGIGATAVLLNVLYQMRAPRVANKIVDGAPTHFPLIGATLDFLPKALNGVHMCCLDLAKRTNFKTMELALAGGEHFIIAMDPIDRKYVLKDNWKNFLKNSSDPSINSALDFFYETMGRGIFTTDKREWQDHRKIASTMFSVNGLRQQMEDVFKEHSKKLVKMLDEVADKGGMIDIQNMFQSFTFDTICEIAFGVSPNAMDYAMRGEREPFLVSFDFAQNVAAIRVIETKYIWEFKRFMGIGVEGEHVEHMKYINNYVYNIIAKRRQANDLGLKNDLLSLYIQFAKKSGQSYIEDDVYLRDVILNFMIAGRDTTACTLTNWFKLVGTSQRGEEIVKRIIDECDQVLKSKQADELTWDSANELTYSDAVFNETIRIYPPVGGDYRMAEHDDVLPSSGFKVPANAKILFNIIAIGRDPNLWENPDTFIPERWVAYADDGKTMVPIKRPDEYVYPVFWGGPRLCLGKDMARFEAKLVACTIFKSFKLDIQPHRDEFINAPVMFYKYPINAYVKRAN